MEIEFFEGLLKIANLLLSVVAGVIAVSMFRISHEKKKFRAWKILIIVLFLFIVQQVLGALRAFDIFSSLYLTHINVSVMLLFLIYALSIQLYISLGEK